jgi:hypothetical protein
MAVKAAIVIIGSAHYEQIELQSDSVSLDAVRQQIDGIVRKHWFSDAYFAGIIQNIVVARYGRDEPLFHFVYPPKSDELSTVLSVQEKTTTVKTVF